MSEEAQRKDWWTPVRVGLSLTVFVLLGFVAMAFQRNCIVLDSGTLECQMNWQWFWTSKPNEIGDTLAGFAGTLAFIWIVVTVWLQSIELGEQREVLIAQKEEFKAMVAAQNAQVEALRAQAAVFEDEKRRRDETANVLFLEENLRSLFLDLTVAWLQRTVWRFEASSENSANVVRRVSLLNDYHGPARVRSPEELMPHLPEVFHATLVALRSSINGRGVLQSAPDIEEFRSIAARINKMLPVTDSLTSGPGERFARLKLLEIAVPLNEILSHEEFWEIPE